VLGPDVDERFDVSAPVRGSLLRQPHHQIEADVVEPGGPRLEHRFACAARRMNPPEPLQLRVAERLHAEADAVHARPAEAVHARRCGGFRIGLQRDLGVRRDVERLAAGGDEPRDLGRLEQRRRPAPEEDRVGCATLRGSDLALEGRDVAIFQPGFEQPTVEIAVVADGAAERNVEVQPEHQGFPKA
jgi:hypothetical protein